MCLLWIPSHPGIATKACLGRNSEFPDCPISASLEPAWVLLSSLMMVFFDISMPASAQVPGSWFLVPDFWWCCRGTPTSEEVFDEEEFFWAGLGPPDFMLQGKGPHLTGSYRTRFCQLASAVSLEWDGWLPLLM